MRDPAAIVADALARDSHVTLTDSTEQDVARAILAALRDEYGTREVEVPWDPCAVTIIPVPAVTPPLYKLGPSTGSVVECYRIDEWHRRFGRPPVFHTILEDDQ